MTEVVLWKPNVPVAIPGSAKTPAEIADYAKQLTPRDRSQLLNAYEAEHYEMATQFVWSRAMAALKAQLGTLGADFIGELLDRQDIGAETSLGTAITDNEAIQLAQELGILGPTTALKLRHQMELLLHLSSPNKEGEEEREMYPEDAIQCLRACVQSVLGTAQDESAVRFKQFRNRLESEPLTPDSAEVVTLLSSSQFFVRTTIKVLLTMAKASQGAKLEHTLANLNLILPKVWDRLPEPDRWSVGRGYAEVNAAGHVQAAKGLKAALTKVQGFDFVPESLRSTTYIAVARALVETHFAIDNFHNEPEKIRALHQLGKSIPSAALSHCLTAVLCVGLGNMYGISYGAQSYVNRILGSLTPDRWKYYLDQCLPVDQVILEKLKYDGPWERWFGVVTKYGLRDLELEQTSVKRLFALMTGTEVRGIPAWQIDKMLVNAGPQE